MATLDTAIVALYEFGGKRFEILVDPEKRRMYKEGKKPDLANVLVVEEVFENARKGERHKSGDIQKAFGTQDIFKIAEIILKKGELQLTTEQKKKMQEEKRKKIIAILARECIDPRTGAPHTQLRLEQALEEARVNIDPQKEAEAQLEDVIKELRLILPMKFEKVKVAVRIPAQYASRAYGTLKEYNVGQEEWQKDGSLIAVVEMPAGLQGEFYDRMNKLTGGSAETRILK